MYINEIQSKLKNDKEFFDEIVTHFRNEIDNYKDGLHTDNDLEIETEEFIDHLWFYVEHLKKNG